MLVITDVCQVLFLISGFGGFVFLGHPRRLLSGDLLKRLFERSQPVWELPDRYFVSYGMTGRREIPARGPG